MTLQLPSNYGDQDEKLETEKEKRKDAVRDPKQEEQ